MMQSDRQIDCVRYSGSQNEVLFVQFQKKTPFVVDTLGGGCHYIKPTKPITFKLCLGTTATCTCTDITLYIISDCISNNIQSIYNNVTLCNTNNTLSHFNNTLSHFILVPPLTVSNYYYDL